MDRKDPRKIRSAPATRGYFGRSPNENPGIPTEESAQRHLDAPFKRMSEGGIGQSGEQVA